MEPTKPIPDGAPQGALLAFPDGRLTWTIADFCRSANISKATFYNMDKAGRAPRTFREGGRRLLTPEAAQAWLNKRQAEAESKS
jgi:predicted DNA-binding transcriptional regulator AlpA